MPADYKKHLAPPEKKPMPGFVWLLIGLAIGLFVALIVYLDKQPQSQVSFAEAVQQELNKIKHISETSEPETKKQSDPNRTEQEPKFNFYTILPELEVLIPDSELVMETPDNNKANSLQTKRAGKRYILQAGSFKNKRDADKLKASLALMGLEASLQPVSINREQWHRVRVGPYDNTRELYSSLNRLQQHGINAMAMELKPE